MSVNANMKTTQVFRLEETESPSGAKKSKWIEEENSILVSIYQVNQFVSRDRYRHTETTHNAVTHYKGLKSGKNRLVQNGIKYEILDVDNSHRLAQISLKEVSTW